MKALFSRFKASASSRETTKAPPPPSLGAVDRDYADEKSLRSLQTDHWSNARPRPFSTASLAKPLPDRPFQLPPPSATGLDNIAPSRPSLPTSPLTHIIDKQPLSSSTTSPTPPQHDSSGRSSRKTTASNNPPLQDVHRRVAFISPLQSPAPPDAPITIPSPAPATPTDDSKRRANTSDALPSKSQLSKLIAIHDGRTSTQSTTSTVKLNATSAAPKGPSRPSLPSPTHISARFNAVGIPITHQDAPSIRGPSLRAGTPFSQMSQRSGVLATASWSEAAEEDLVSNLGQRERTRQEVLWEIVASEERYVLELIKMKETFIDPLLHPFAPTPLASMQEEETWRIGSPAESIDLLPIASRFLGSTLRTDTPSLSAHGPVPVRNQATGTPVIPTPDNDSTETDDDDGQDANDKGFAANAAHPRSPYGAAVRGVNLRTGKPILPFQSRSHQSLPPPPRAHTLGAVSASSLAKPQERPGTVEPERKDGTRVLKKLKRNTVQESVVTGALPPHLLPEDLRRCLEVIETGILVGHVRLSEALRKRYEEQYPLVRSLADVFVTNSIILNEYATYVLHLERALEQVDSALSAASIIQRPKKQDAGQWVLICRALQRLEENAADKGETGLAISLSKPFQRLLKYPLLFQNLLFHTDPSTFEYESTLQMVAEVESIVRSIEDEKIQKEERDKTRDIFARIDGLEKDKILAVFKPSRMLVEERPLDATSYDPPTRGTPPSAMGGATSPNGTKDRIVAKKTSFRRISEVLQPSAEKSVGGKKDLWLVVFNDVVLRCQRTGVTSLPLATTANSRASSMPEMQAKGKHGTTRRAAPVRTRNLYRFIKVESWTINQRPKPRDIVSKEDIERSRTHLVDAQGADDESEDGENDSDDSDRKSKMSFSYWGADKVTLTKVIPSKRTPANSRAPSRAKPQAPSSFAGRSSEKDAKFGNRMRSPEPSTVEGSVSVRPASRRTGITSPQPATRRNVTGSEDSKLGDSTSSRPAWGQNTRAAPLRPGAIPYLRPRTISQTGIQPASRKTVGSPAPSEDSGVGMYRRIVAHDPTMS